MVVQSGVLPYEYIDIPFTFLDRYGGPPSGLGMSPELPLIPEISGFLYEQAMYVHLAEIRKHGDFGFDDHSWSNFIAATATTVYRDEITNPDPSGVNVSQSGNPYAISFVQELRDSMDLVFQGVARDSEHSQQTVRTDYFQVSFSGLPSGQNGDYQYRIHPDALFFGPGFGADGLLPPDVVGGSGFLDTQTLTEISYQPYSRFSRRGDVELLNVRFETAPVFPALITAQNQLPIFGNENDKFKSGKYFAWGGLPQTSGYNFDAAVSGRMRLCGDAFSENTKVRFVSEANNPWSAAAPATRRWIGELEHRNVGVSESGIIDTPGMVLMDEGAVQNLQHGVHRAIVSTSGFGYGGESGQISVYPPSGTEHPTGFENGVVGIDRVTGFKIVRNTSGGQPASGTTTVSGTQNTRRTLGVHVCDNCFGSKSTSGVVSISPFNGSGLMLAVVDNINKGGTGLQTNAFFTKVGPPTWVWRQSYSASPALWRNAGTLIKKPGASEAYAFMGTDWVFRSYSFQNFVGPVQPPGAPQQAGSKNSTRGLGQTERYQFLKLNLNDRSVEEARVSYGHLSRTLEYGLNGVAYSRNFGWFGVGDKSSNSHAFESWKLSGEPDAGTGFIPSNAGGLQLAQPIGIGNKAFAKLSADIVLNIRRWWEIDLSGGAGYNTVLVKAYDLVIDGDVPFDISDVTLIGFSGHTIFVPANDEGVTEGDWIVISTNIGNYLCRIEVDSSAQELQIKEMLYRIEGPTPAIWMPT